MPPVGFEPTISAGERPQTCALGRAAAGTEIIIASLFHNFYLSYIITVILINNYANFRLYNKLKFPVPLPQKCH